MARTTESEITERIRSELASGVLPWVARWNEYGNGMPRNVVTGWAYSGANVSNLWAIARAFDYPTHNWLSRTQLFAIPGVDVKGQKFAKGFYFDWIEKKDAAGNVVEEYPLYKPFIVMNVHQVKGLPEHYYDRPAFNPDQRDAELDALMGALNLPVVERRNPAYDATTDQIGMPDFCAFESRDAYYALLFRQAAKWAGHATRMNRVEGLAKKFGSDAGAVDEMACELAAAFLCARFGFNSESLNHAGYIDLWCGLMDEHDSAYTKAAGLASATVRFMEKQVPAIKPKGVKTARKTIKKEAA